MPDFLFEGRIPSSKSLMNRALIVRSHATPRFFLSGESDAEDVVFLRKALGKIEDGKEYYLGDGGTTLRFFALRAARESGTFTLKVSDRLFRRPQKALQEVLGSLGVQMESGDNLFTITSKGWQAPSKALKVPVGDSSQFASAVVLNAWELPYDLEISLEGQRASESYLKMTLELCRHAGMTILETPTGLKIPRDQKVQMKSYSVESDLSSVFSIAALAALGGQATFLEIPEKSLQPDRRFAEIFRQMGVPVEHRDQRLIVRKASELKAIDVDLGESPDLVPVLSIVCAFAKGRSILKGAPQLRHKESDRIQSSALLLKKMGVVVTERDDGLEIEGNPDLKPGEFEFDPDKDHRLAMAAGVLIRLGWPLSLKEPEVVHKSFPEFWHILKTGPHLVVGHRGTGKTSLIERLSPSAAQDLDAEIEKKSGQDVFTIFRDHGEEGFRQKEISILKEVVAKASPQTWIALGAGFRLDDEGFEKHGEILWARRDTDREGRVFLDRPRLDPTADPLVEFRLRARGRENLYSRYADRVYTIPEGLHRPGAIENKILLGSLSETGGVVTMFPIHRRGIPQLGADYYELRDDLLDPDEIHSLFHKLPPEKILYSVRRHKHIPEFIRKSGCWIDWALDFAYPEKDLVEYLASRLILSSHGTLKESLLDFRLYSKFNVHWKLSPPIESYEDLQEGHLWWKQSPETRSFLPRSAEGRWAWYRLWMKGRSRFNFWREGVGSSLDQPTLWQWLATPTRAESFAAVLGAPVYHSWTPTEHYSFFAERKMPVWPIDVREGEWGKALPFLQDLGLRYAAVTAPLKGRAFRTGTPSPLAQELGSVNTLFLDNKNCWHGHNTDLEGLVEALRPWPTKSVAIWGGGGTLPVLGKVLPEASAFSSTGGHLRQGSKPLVGPPEVVIWAAPRGTDLKWPSADWKPGLVIDLNYKEDSPGREYALRCKAKYVSGETMFRAQAEGQRQFWKEKEK